MNSLNISEPRIEHRDEQHFVAIQMDLIREKIPELLPPLIPELFKWLEKNRVEPSGPPFFSYVKMEGKQMRVKVGILTDSNVSSDESVEVGSFPEGNYMVATYKGDYSNLYNVHSRLEEWRVKNGIRLSGPLTEFYPSDPAIETNPDKWITIITNQIMED
jgi:effector-binding domain-containing protein